MQNSITISRFCEKSRKDFYRISKDWLEGFGLWEPIDDMLCKNPVDQIIRKNGEIFIARDVQNNNQCIGIVAIRETAAGFELMKMRVIPTYQGKGIGKKLCQKAIEFAKSKRAKSIVLSTTSDLKIAIGLYEKMGFKITDRKSSTYDVCDCMMEMHLSYSG